MWLWCLIAAFGLSFSVACSDDDEKEVTPTPPVEEPTPTPPPVEEPTPTQSVFVVDTMEVAANIEEVPYTGGTITFTTTTNQDYTVASTADWITIDSDGRALTATYTVTATVAANEGEAREGKITVTFADEAKTVKEVVVKQAAYVAPTPEPTPEPTQPAGGYVVPEGAKTYTVEVDVAGYVEVQDKYNVADLIAGADPEATIQMAYLDENGQMAWQDWTVTDGWFGAEGAHGWGEGCIACIKPNADGSFAYVAAFSGLEVGATATAIFNYGNDVIVAITANVVASPEVPVVPGIEIEADYVLEVEVAQDNGYGATYIALDGTEFGYWGAYSDPDDYETTIQDVSVDITPEIEAALGIEADGLEDAINGGSVYVGAYGLDENGEVYFRDCYEEKGSNFFYWFSEAGYAQGWGDGAFFCIDNIGFHSDAIQLYGTTCMFPSSAQIGSTYSGYVVFKTDDAEYVVEVKGTAVAAPEKKPLPEFEVVKTYEETYTGTNPGAYTTPDPIFSIEAIMPDIQELIGGEADLLMMGYYDDNLELAFQEWSVTDGWFGEDQAAGWGSQAQMFCLKPVADGTFSYCAAIADGAVNCKCTYRYANTATLKAVDVTVTVTLE